MSVLSDEAVTDLDLRGIGRLLAFTSNDEVNALAVERYARVFGRREVFQLAPTERAGSTVPAEYLGRIIGIDPLNYVLLDERSRQGWQVSAVAAGSAVENATADQRFIPLFRLVERRLAILCRNDPLPTTGEVIGLAAPATLKALVDHAA